MTAASPLLVLRRLRDEFLGQWRSSLRFRLAIRLIGLLLMIYGVLVLADVRKALAEAESREFLHLERLQALTTQTEWPERAKLAQTELNRLESVFWSASSRGLAQATVQDRLERMGRDAGIEGLSVRAETPQISEVNSDVSIVSAAIEGRFDPDSWLRLMVQLSRYETVLHIERMDVVNEGQRPRFNMIVRAPFLTAGIAGQSSPSGSGDGQ